MRVDICRVIYRLFEFPILCSTSSSKEARRGKRRERRGALCTLAYRFLLYWARSFERDNTHTTIYSTHSIVSCRSVWNSSHALHHLRPLFALCRLCYTTALPPIFSSICQRACRWWYADHCGYRCFLFRTIFLSLFLFRFTRMETWNVKLYFLLASFSFSFFISFFFVINKIVEIKFFERWESGWFIGL